MFSEFSLFLQHYRPVHTTDLFTPQTCSHHRPVHTTDLFTLQTCSHYRPVHTTNRPVHTTDLFTPQTCVHSRVGPVFAHRMFLFAAEKALLMKLRKSTGYTFTNCKKALEKFDNDITQAETWLHEQAKKEGWSKAHKLEGRKAKEGLIGLFVGDDDAVMVEVNCETDFVARNEKFQELVKAVAFATLAHHKNKTQNQTGYVKSLLAGEDLNKLTLTEGVTLADHVAFVIGRLGENMSVRRAVTLGVPSDWHIGSYVHGSVPGQTEVTMGRYGALVVFQGGPAGEEEAAALGRKLGSTWWEKPRCLWGTWTTCPVERQRPGSCHRRFCPTRAGP
ncbi:hypothetical protein WMY93_011231 [Mugilogobius chulae]|uniref:Elongation factor Ts, mitochondrial n=1 Tax=Mugilogobius chulae TaxID=88201 RepID=A0AAW0P210_9GOBI